MVSEDKVQKNAQRCQRKIPVKKPGGRGGKGEKRERARLGRAGGKRREMSLNAGKERRCHKLGVEGEMEAGFMDRNGWPVKGSKLPEVSVRRENWKKKQNKKMGEWKRERKW